MHNTTTIIMPQRIASDHYQVASFRRKDKIYNLRFDHTTQAWNCDCPDTIVNKNNHCKHTTLLKTWIIAQKHAQQKVQQEATEIVNQVVATTPLTEQNHIDPQHARTLHQTQHNLIAEQDAIIHSLNQKITTIQEEHSYQLNMLLNQVVTLQQQLTAAQETNTTLFNTISQRLEALTHHQEHTLTIHLASSTLTTPQAYPTATIQQHTIIEETNAQGKCVACLIDGFKVLCGPGFAISCTCTVAEAGKDCKHMLAINAYIDQKKSLQHA
ncbi:hypothetical protein [Dictyobacter kobayashii]|uniref:SWIM-type domain-containing protein n=1 Tax=Dictyobacter kobayashii TaxID=2014872 RepID=A0A402AET3_9CHLR|nr:hypothetical protein [Dictyobacter kobayashii]GCE17562.1 hypothetical protein KDK_13620 [Dictyobacter kobayashii]